MKAYTTKMTVLGAKNKAVEELKSIKQLEIRFGKQP